MIRLLNIAENFRRLYVDQFEYVALKVLLLITPGKQDSIKKKKKKLQSPASDLGKVSDSLR